MEGFQVLTPQDVVSDGDIFVTTTGNKDMIMVDHMKKMKNNAIVCEIGHFVRSRAAPSFERRGREKGREEGRESMNSDYSLTDGSERSSTSSRLDSAELCSLLWTGTDSDASVNESNVSLNESNSFKLEDLFMGIVCPIVEHLDLNLDLNGPTSPPLEAHQLGLLGGPAPPQRGPAPPLEAHQLGLLGGPAPPQRGPAPPLDAHHLGLLGGPAPPQRGPAPPLEAHQLGLLGGPAPPQRGPAPPLDAHHLGLLGGPAPPQRGPAPPLDAHHLGLLGGPAPPQRGPAPPLDAHQLGLLGGPAPPIDPPQLVLLGGPAPIDPPQLDFGPPQHGLRRKFN